MMRPTGHDGRGGLRLQGVGISKGRAIGQAYVYREPSLHECMGVELLPEQIESEYQRLLEAMQKAEYDLAIVAREWSEEQDPRIGEIFQAHQTILQSASLKDEIRRELESARINAEEAVTRVLRRWARRFEGAQCDRISCFGEDVDDLADRVLRSLQDIHAHQLRDLPANSILVTQRLLPSDTVYLLRNSAVGAVLAEGGPGSHAALITRQLGIPAVAGVVDDIERIAHGDTVLLDGATGEVVVGPEDATVTSFEAYTRMAARKDRALQERARSPAQTRDGRVVRVMLNVGTREDSLLGREYGGDGIGLYRTE